MLQFAASGICQFMNQTLFAILEDEQDYHRLDSNFMTPTHVCYGNHNRTVAARLPQNPPRRIEYRLCSNYSDPYRALFIILKSSLFGIKNKLNNYSQIFGNAFDPQYNLTKLPENLFQAKKLFNINFFLQP
jgi:glutamine synthetase